MEANNLAGLGNGGYAMVLPYGYEDVHFCDALLLSCPDFRFKEQTLVFMKEHLQLNSYDGLGLPGGGREISLGSSDVFGYVKLLCNIHRPTKIVVVHHEDCAAYGGSSEFGHNSHAEKNFHKRELLRIKKALLNAGIQKEIVLVYQELIHNKRSIGFVIVDPEERVEDCPKNTYAGVA